MHQGRFRLDIQKNLFSGVVRHWNRLSRGWWSHQKRLDVILRLKVLVVGDQLDWMILEIISSLGDSVILFCENSDLSS